MAKTDDVPTTDLMSLGTITGTMERPKSLDPNDLSGTEGITAADIRLPRIGVAQGMSHQMTPGDPLFIEGLTLFDMFNDLTNEIYGKGPFTFVPVRRDVRGLEFRPRTEGGGLLDSDVPLDDPRMDWTDDDGDGRKETAPRATKFVEFVVLLLRPARAPEPVVLSIPYKNKFMRRAGDQLTTFIAGRQAAIYSGLYTVDTKVPGKNDKGTFGVFTIRNAGFIPKDTPAGAMLFDMAKRFHEQLKGVNIVVDRETQAAEVDDFDPEQYERS